MSASAWERAVEESAIAIYGYAWDQFESRAAAWRADGSDEYGGFSTSDAERDEARDVARAVLADALPVLLEELADRIEYGTEDWSPSSLCDPEVVRIVRGFAAEVTQ